MSTFQAVIRQSIRRWAGRPELALTAIVTLGLGIGTTTAIFSVVDGVLLRPLPYREPGRLVTMWVVRPPWRTQPGFNASWNRGLVSWLDLRDLEANTRTLESVGVWTAPRQVMVAGQDDVVQAREISSGLLRTLGVSPQAGRGFTREEEDGPSDVLMISYSAWQRRFGGDDSVLGRRLAVDDRPRTIVGVLPKGFVVEGDQPELLLPIGSLNPRDRTVTNRNDANRAFQAIARLKPGLAIDAAAADVEPVLRAGKDPTVQTSRLEPLDDLFFGVSRRPLLLLLGGSGLLLLIACANVTGLLLGDVHGRRQEMAIRQALGAGTWRVARQLLSETIVLAGCGGALGLVSAWWIAPVLAAMAPAGLPRLDSVGVDARALGFALLASLATTVVSGTVPALMWRSADSTSTLRNGRSGAPRGRTQRVLVAAQVSLAMVLLVGAALLGETVVRLTAQPLGFEPKRLIMLRPALMPSLPPEVRASRRAALLESLRNTPGVESVAAVSAAPFGGNYGGQTIEIDEQPGQFLPARRYIIGRDYFRTMGMSLLRGRDFGPGDVGGPPVVVVSRDFERRYFAGDALMRRVRINKEWMTVVGVAPDTKLRELAEGDEPAFYFSLEQMPRFGAGEIVIRTRGKAAAMAPAIRQAALGSSPGMVIVALDMMDSLMHKTIAEERYRAVLSSTFGIAALLLAAIGLYGLLARRVAEQRRELGLRMAIGARPSDIVLQISSDAGRLVLIGLAIGVPAAIGAAHLLRTELWGVEPSEPHVFVIGSVTLLTTAALAALVPAIRASRVDPIVALRTD